MKSRKEKLFEYIVETSHREQINENLRFTASQLAEELPCTSIWKKITEP